MKSKQERKQSSTVTNLGILALLMGQSSPDKVLSIHKDDLWSALGAGSASQEETMCVLAGLACSVFSAKVSGSFVNMPYMRRADIDKDGMCHLQLNPFVIEFLRVNT